MSGRWGERPLGRGMEDRVIRSQSGFSGRSAALASSKTKNRSRQPLYHSRNQTTPDYLRSLCSIILLVDSSLVSFLPVPPYFRVTSVSVLDYRFRITFSRCSINSRSFSLSSFDNEESACASDSTRRRRPSWRVLVPFAVALRRTRRPSSVSPRPTLPPRPTPRSPP